jgi:hypothetical protein
MLSGFLAGYPSLLPGQLDSSGTPTGAQFQVSLLVRGWGGCRRVLGGWSEIEIKANSAQLKLELGLSLAIYKRRFAVPLLNDHHICSAGALTQLRPIQLFRRFNWDWVAETSGIE